MKERKEADSAPLADLSQKIVFKKRKERLPDRTDDNSDEGDKPAAASSFVGSKTLMPEYVVGRGKAAKKPPKKAASVDGQKQSKSQLKLSHLDQDEEEEEDA